MAEKSKEHTKINWQKSPDGVYEIYANSAHLTWSLDDVRIRLGQLIFGANPGESVVPVTEERAAVTFTWRNAKNLRNQLASLIDNYEKTNGEIKMDIKLAPNDSV